MALSDFYPEMKGWSPVDPLKESLSEIRPAIPDPNSQVSAFLRTTQPLVLQYQQDTIKQYNRPGLSSYRVAPLAPNASAVTQAATASTAKIITQQIISSSGSGGISSVGFTAPIEAVITGSPVVPPGGVINWSWATEAAGTVFSGPNANVVGFDAAFTSGGLGSPILIVGGTPSASPEWALYTAAAQALGTAPAGWTSLLTNSDNAVYAKQITSATTVTQPFTGANIGWAGTLTYFNGTLPTIVQNSNALFSTTSSTATFGSNTTAGNDVLVIVNLAIPSGGTISTVAVSVSDSQGNSVQALNFALRGHVFGVDTGAQSMVFIIPNVSAAAESVTIRLSDAATGVLSILEIPPPPTLAAIPRFRVPSAVNLGITGPGGVFGNLRHVNLNAGINASATTFWRGDDTWSAVAFSNLSGNISTTQMNSGTGASASTFWRGDGTWSALGELAVVNLTTQSANIVPTTLFAVGSLGTTTQMFRISAYVILTTADVGSSTLPNVQILYTDPDTNTVITIDATPVLAGAGLGQTGALTANTVGLTATGTIAIEAKTGTNIQYQTVNYASGVAAAMKYSLRIRLEAL